MALLALIKNQIIHLYYQVIGEGSDHPKKLWSKYQKQLKNFYLTFFPVPKFFMNLEHFFIWAFFHLTFMNHMTVGTGGGATLTSLYHLHLLCEQEDIRWMIATESSFLHIVSDRTRTGNLWFPSAEFITKESTKP